MQIQAHTSISVPQLTECDNLMASFMTTHNISGTSFAVAKSGELAYRAFGNANLAGTEAALPPHLFRISEYSPSVYKHNSQLYFLADNSEETAKINATPTTTIGTASGCDGGSFNIPIDIINGDSIGAISFKITFDTAQLQFSQIVNPHSNLGSTLTNTNAVLANANGEIVIAWFDLGSGKNFGNSKLFDLEFIGKDTGTTTITWINTAPYGEISDGIGNVKVGSIFNNGTATVNPGIIGTFEGDTTICQGEPTLIDFVLPNSGVFDIVLETNSNQITIPNQSVGAQLQVTLQDSATYILKNITNTSTGCSLVNINDTVQINVNPTPVVNLGNDTTFCSPDSLLLNAGSGGTDYLWNNSATSQIIHVLTTDVYSVIVSNSFNCFGYDTISVIVNQKPTGIISGDTTICAGNLIVVEIDLPPSGSFDVNYIENGNARNLTGQNGTIQLNITPSDSVLYILQNVTNTVTGCALTNIDDSASVHVNALPIVNLGADTAICSDETLTLDAGSDGISYLWSDASTAQTLLVDTTGIFSVNVIDVNTCTNTDTISIIVNCFTITGRLFYPNSQSSPLKNANVELLNYKGFLVALPGNSTGSKVKTDTLGNYTFTKVPLGDYFITPKIIIPAGGWTIDDAIQAVYIFAQIIPFDALDLRVGDVNADNIVNAVDGMFINKKASGAVFPFPAGSWVYDNEIVKVRSDLYKLIRAICVGDLNKSYIPPQ